MFDTMTNAYHFLAKGGLTMIPIGLCSLAAVVIFFERYLVLRAAQKQGQNFRLKILEAINDKQFERASTLCDQSNAPLSMITRAALEHKEFERDAIQEAMIDEARRQSARLERWIPMLGAIANVSPLLGLLGTVTGMIQVFGRLADEFLQGTQANPAMLANGIWEALLTTAAGLTVAIPSFILHRMLISRFDEQMLNIEQSATEVLNALSPHPKAQ